jgi:hypothetical protein
VQAVAAGAGFLPWLGLLERLAGKDMVLSTRILSKVASLLATEELGGLLLAAQAGLHLAPQAAAAGATSVGMVALAAQATLAVVAAVEAAPHQHTVQEQVEQAAVAALGYG